MTEFIFVSSHIKKKVDGILTMRHQRLLRGDNDGLISCGEYQREADEVVVAAAAHVADQRQQAHAVRVRARVRVLLHAYPR